MNRSTQFKKIRILPLLIAPALVATICVSAGQAVAQSATPMRLGGIIDDFTPVVDVNGPWQVSGQWSLTLTGYSGRGNFSVSLNMARAENPDNRSPHTHQVAINDGQITAVPNGFQISGNAIITSNGTVAGISGSPLLVQVTGGSAIPFSNIALTFGGAAAAHFSDQPLHGVVTQR